MIWLLFDYTPEQVLAWFLVGLALIMVVMGFLHEHHRSLQHECETQGHTWDFDENRQCVCTRCGADPYA